MKEYLLKNAVRVSGGKFFGNTELLEREVTDVVTDSREVTPGCVFCAIRGERVDGHDYIEQAMNSGALCVIAERTPKNPEISHILVSSTLAAIRFIAADYREGFYIPVIGITGSVGKTSAKEMISRVLSQRMNVLYTKGNMNNTLGVPLTLFRLEPEHQAAVIEMGISEFNEMTRLTRIAKPNAAVFTAIGDAHLENLGTREGVLKAKVEILDGMPMGSIAFINGDDELLRGLRVAPRKKISFGIGEDCDVRAVNIKSLGAGGTTCTVTGLGREFPLKIPAYGRHMLYAALAAAAVGLYFGLSGEEIAEGVAQYEVVGHRALVKSAGELTVVDDCYNANPSSVAMALESLTDLGARRSVAILGDMLELGENEERLHHDIGALAARLGIVAITCGKLARVIARGSSETGGEATHFEDKTALIAALPELVRPGDAILVKASRGMSFEEIVMALTQADN